MGQMKNSSRDTPPRGIGINARLSIDRILQQTPCICGATDTWHRACYNGKTDEQVASAYDRVYAKLAKTMPLTRKIIAIELIERARRK